MPSRQNRIDVMIEIGGYELDDGSYDYERFMDDVQNDRIDWSQHRWTDDELYLYALKQPPEATPTPRRNPALRFDHVPIDLESIIDVGGGIVRIVYTTVADDGYPTTGVVRVQTAGQDRREAVRLALIEEQRKRSKRNRRAKAITERRAAISTPAESGSEVPDLLDLDSEFPTNRA